MSGQSAPVGVFAYNRADHLERMFASLAACNGFGESRITLFIDGPRHERDAPAVERVRAFARAQESSHVRVQVSETNKGLRRSVHAGMTQLCAEAGRAIAFEDDFQLAPQVLDYFNAALNRYADEPRIWSIVGYAYDAPELRGRKDAVILPFAHPWGWATWSRAWDRFPVDVHIDPEDLASPTFRRRFDMEGFYPFSQQLENASKGLVDSWFIRWYYTIFRHGGASVFPPERLVENYGVSGGGAHSSRLNPYDLLVTRAPLMQGDPILPDVHGDDLWALDLMGRAREASVHRLIAHIGALKRRLGRR